MPNLSDLARADRMFMAFSMGAHTFRILCPNQPWANRFYEKHHGPMPFAQSMLANAALVPPFVQGFLQALEASGFVITAKG